LLKFGPKNKSNPIFTQILKWYQGIKHGKRAFDFDEKLQRDFRSIVYIDCGAIKKSVLTIIVRKSPKGLAGLMSELTCLLFDEYKSQEPGLSEYQSEFLGFKFFGDVNLILAAKTSNVFTLTLKP